MDQYAFLLGYYDKQLQYLKEMSEEIVSIDVELYAERYVFAARIQQFYTALEDLFKQIAKTFENHVKNNDVYHKEMLIRMHTDIPHLRPAVISKPIFVFLDKLRAFRHFFRHAYNCELELEHLLHLQNLFKESIGGVEKDLFMFRSFVEKLYLK